MKTFLLMVWILNFHSGRCEPKRLQKLPIIEENNDERIYRCKFDIPVDCFWSRNNITSNIHPYKYVDKNESIKTDCSIKAPKSASKFYNMECIGIAHIISITIETLEIPMQLNCSAKQSNICSWKRNDSIVTIDGDRYKYVGDNKANNQDCTIIIKKVAISDAGIWFCSEKKKENTPGGQIVALYELKTLAKQDQPLQQSTALPFATFIISTLITSTKSTLEKTTEISENTTRINFNIDEKSQHDIYVYLWLIGAGLLVIIALLCFREYRQYRVKQNSREQPITQKSIEKKTEESEIPSLQDVSCSPAVTQFPTYYNTAEPRPQLKSVDDEGYLVPLRTEKRKQLKRKSEEYEMVKNHVYEKVTE